jgi:hypothetical protein
MNLYRYTRNNSINLTDPTGLDPFDPDQTSVDIKGPGNLTPGYGNYCGPGNTGKYLPIDDLDAACQSHDMCYKANGLSGWDVLFPPDSKTECGDNDKSKKKKDCDKALCSKLSGVEPGSGYKNSVKSIAQQLFCK